MRTVSSPSIDRVIELQAWRLRELLKWREYIKILIEAVKEVFGRGAEVYIFGSATENRLTVDSDIDVAIVMKEVPKSGIERAELLDKLWRAMEARGVPWWYPFEIHIMTKEELSLLREAKFIKML